MSLNEFNSICKKKKIEAMKNIIVKLIIDNIGDLTP